MIIKLSYAFVVTSFSLQMWCVQN